MNYFRLISGVEGLTFSLVLSYLAAGLSRAFAKRISANVAAIWGLTTAAYILVLVCSIAVHRLGMLNPVNWLTAFCLGLIMGNRIYWLAARGTAD